jgi:hypothetical protein
MSSYNTIIKKEITKNTKRPLSLIDEKKMLILYIMNNKKIIKQDIIKNTLVKQIKSNKLNLKTLKIIKNNLISLNTNTNTNTNNNIDIAYSSLYDILKLKNQYTLHGIPTYGGIKNNKKSNKKSKK